jgi:hypothetical protein
VVKGKFSILNKVANNDNKMLLIFKHNSVLEMLKYFKAKFIMMKCGSKN